MSKTVSELRIRDVKALIGKYGNKTLGDILECMKESRPYECPKCEGRGYTVKDVNTYPSGLPDSGWVTKYETKHYDCDLCEGEGYTMVEYEPVYTVKGWKEC